MERLIITNTPINSGDGDTLKVAFDKVNDNFEYLFDNTLIENLSQLNNDVGFITASAIPETYQINDIVGLTASLQNLQNNINQLGASYSISANDILNIQGDINSINNTIISLNSIINNQNVIISDIQNSISQLSIKYLVLTATIRQNGTDNPELFILDNTFDVEFNIERISTGVYKLFSSDFKFGAPSRTFITVGLTKSGFLEGQFGQAYVDVSDEVIIIQTGRVNVSLSDELLTDTPIEIRFYI